MENDYEDEEMKTLKRTFPFCRRCQSNRVVCQFQVRVGEKRERKSMKKTLPISAVEGNETFSFTKASVLHSRDVISLK